MVIPALVNKISLIEELNFGPKMIQMINHLYLNDTNFSRILLNGYLGKKNISPSRYKTGRSRLRIPI